jgi:hypothetical protein
MTHEPISEGVRGLPERDWKIMAGFYGTRRYEGAPLTHTGWSFTEEGLRAFVAAVRSGKVPNRFAGDDFND